ncbi:MAG: HAD hydrolase-like protein [Spirosomataceae bacterium]
MNQPIQLVVFDMAGTTVTDQHEVEACFAKAARLTGIDATDEEILAVQGLAKRYVFQLFWRKQLGESHPDVEQRVDESYALFKDILEEHYHTQPVLPTDGCLALFDYLHKHHIKIALTTGFYRIVTDIILDKLGWLESLDEHRVGTASSIIQASIASDEVEQGRPHPLMIQKAMRLLGVTDPQKVINVGDTPSDLQSGRAAGVYLNVGVTNGTHTAEQLMPHPHDALIGSVAKIIDILEKINRTAEAVKS